MPLGLEVTNPEPLPASVTTSEYSSAKLAVTVWFALSVTVHVPVPVQAPVHPTNVELIPGAAVNVIVEPDAYSSVQSVPQSMPEGADVIVPVPLPLAATFSANEIVESIGTSPERQTPPMHSSPGGHEPLGPHVIAPSLNSGEKHAPSTTKRTSHNR
jgi:hypothetical protein